MLRSIAGVQPELMAVRGVDDEPDEGTGEEATGNATSIRTDWMAADLGLAVHGSGFSESGMREL